MHCYCVHAKALCCRHISDGACVLHGCQPVRCVQVGAARSPAQIVVTSAAEREGGVTRLALFSAARLLVLLTDSPTSTVALRNLIAAEGHVLFAFCSAAHRFKFAAQDTARKTRFSQALRSVLLLTVE